MPLLDLFDQRHVDKAAVHIEGPGRSKTHLLDCIVSRVRIRVVTNDIKVSYCTSVECYIREWSTLSLTYDNCTAPSKLGDRAVCSVHILIAHHVSLQEA